MWRGDPQNDDYSDTATKSNAKGCYFPQSSRPPSLLAAGSCFVQARWQGGLNSHPPFLLRNSFALVVRMTLSHGDDFVSLLLGRPLS